MPKGRLDTGLTHQHKEPEDQRARTLFKVFLSPCTVPFSTFPMQSGFSDGKTCTQKTEATLMGRLNGRPRLS